jgi:hypothetical protein
MGYMRRNYRRFLKCSQETYLISQETYFISSVNFIVESKLAHWEPRVSIGNAIPRGMGPRFPPLQKERKDGAA